ncbi:MAG: hypothetical protein PUB67_01380 [Clostridiales bacterium]|nr:hypothetical protein [Clostridiales bacterium]
MEDYSTDLVIDIKQFVAYIMRKWFVIILFMIAFGGLLALYGKGRVGNETVVADYETEGKIESYAAEITKRENQIKNIDEKISRINDSVDDYTKKLEELSGRQEPEIQEAVIAVCTKIDSLNMDLSGLDLQKKNVEVEINNYNSMIERVKGQFEDLRGMSYEEYLDKKGKPESMSSSPVKKAVKYGIVGIIVGAFLAIVLICIRYFTDGKLKDVDRFKYGYNVSVIRMVYPYCGKKRGFYNRVIDKLEGYRNPKATLEEEYEIVAGRLSLLAGDGEELIITGTVGGNELESAADNIKKAAASKEYKLVKIENPAENAVDADMLKNKKVILVEKRGSIPVKQIEELISLLRLASCEIVGVVLI